MRDLQLDLGVKKIAIKDEDGDVITVLRVNIADASTPIVSVELLNGLK